MKILELLIFLFVIPLLVAVAPWKLPHIPLLVCGGLYATIRVWPKVAFWRLFARPPRHWWRGPLLRASLFGVAATLYICVNNPDFFLSFPRSRPGFWLLVMLLYPVLSVLPQEIIYRVYIFEKFFPEPKKKGLAIAVSTVLFAWVHVVYAGYFAMLSTFVAGAVLGMTYTRYRAEPGALWPVLLEHSLYGMLLFTVGMGRYFYMAR